MEFISNSTNFLCDYFKWWNWRRSIHRQSVGCIFNGMCFLFCLLLILCLLISLHTEPFQIAIDEDIQSAVQYCVHITCLHIGTVILDQCVRLQYIGTDLVAPADLCYFTTDSCCFFSIVSFRLIIVSTRSFHRFVSSRAAGSSSSPANARYGLSAQDWTSACFTCASSCFFAASAGMIVPAPATQPPGHAMTSTKS